MVENLKQLYIGTQNKSSRRAHNRRGPTQDPHSFPPKELATSGNDQVYYPNTRIHTRAQDRGYEAHAPGRTYRGSDENYDNTQSKFKPNVAHAVRQSSSREGKYASSQLDDNTMKNVKKYSYHGRYPYSAAARQSPRDMLQPLDTEEIFGKTSDFATQQRYATSTESTTEKKLFYVKDSFFDNLSCASKDRRPSGVDSNYRNKRHEENNMNMQTFGEILNFSSRHPRFKYSDNYRKNQQNGQRHDYAGNDSSFSHRHNSQNSNREKYRRNKPELPQDQIKAMDSSRVA